MIAERPRAGRVSFLGARVRSQPAGMGESWGACCWCKREAVQCGCGCGENGQTDSTMCQHAAAVRSVVGNAMALADGRFDGGSVSANFKVTTC